MTCLECIQRQLAWFAAGRRAASYITYLVGAVEEGQQLAALRRLQDAGPLVGCGVHAGGVVGAGVQQQDGALGGGAHILQQALQAARPAGGQPKATA